MEITLKEQRLTKSLTLWADKARRTPEEMLENAVETYLAELEAELLRQETDVFWNRLPELKEQFPHQFVAIYQGKVVDHSVGLDKLMRRVQENFGDLPVLIASVDAPPPREIHWSGGRR
jgi:hypothetical protein